jgi:transposase
MGQNESDRIRDAVIARAETLGLSAYEIAKRCDGSPNSEAVKRYLTRRCSLSTRYVSTICDVLGLELKPKKKVNK